MSKCLQTYESLRVLQDNSVSDLLFALLNHWLLSPDTFANFYLTQSVIELSDLLVYSKSIWQKFKSSQQTLQAFIQL